MNFIASSAKRVPLIKFPVRVPWVPKLQEFTSETTPATTTPKSAPVSSSGSGWIVPDTVEVFRVIPDRFRRRPIDPVELEFIARGGPE